jgi:hypothetical protein
VIRFSLRCDNGHGFEGWFRGNDDFNGQKERGLVTCPACGSAAVEKALMAPSVATARKREERVEQLSRAPMAQAGASVDAPAGKAPAAPAVSPSGPQAADLAARLRALKAEMLASAVDVGTAFPEEARKIHYGEAEARGIYGAASGEEVRELLDEGIQVLPLPVLPEDRN